MFMAAIASRNSAETSVPMTPPIPCNASNRLWNAVAVGGDRDRGQHDDGRVAEREEEADRDRPLALLHQLARDIVDRGDVIGIDRVAQAEAIGQQGRAEQNGVVMERHQRPGPGGDIGGDQDRVEARNPAPEIAGLVAEDAGNHALHACPRKPAPAVILSP